MGDKMSEIIHNAVSIIQDFISTNNIFLSLIIGFLIIVLESILPFLPLAVFIALNKLVFGNLIGFLLSWGGTVIGCILAFVIFRKGLSDRLYTKVKRDGYRKTIDRISNIRFTSLVIITALPFTPAFTVNIAAGLSKISYRKFISAILIAKLSIVYFWGYVGTSFVESISNPIILVRIALMLLGVYIISKLVNRKFDIK